MLTPTPIDRPGAHDSTTKPDPTQQLQHETAHLQILADAYQREILEQQPLTTQRRLTKQTRQIFNSYREHGSRARLSHHIMAFLEGKMDVKDVVMERKDCAVGGKMRARIRDELEVWPVVTGAENENRHVNEFGDGYTEQMDDIDVNGPDQVLDEMDLDQDEPEIEPETAAYDCNNSTDNTTLLPTRVPSRLRTNDLHTSLHVAPFLPFDPLTTVLLCDEDTQMSPDLVTILSTIFALYNNLGSAMLRQLTTKYGPEPVFRAGIRELLQSRVEDMVKTPQDTGLGLTTEVRNVLKGVFEGHQGFQGIIGGDDVGAGPRAGAVKNGELNAVEIRLLAQVTGTGRETIEMFWDDMHVRRRAWGGLCTIVARREIEKTRAEKDRRRGREEVMLMMQQNGGMDGIMGGGWQTG